MSAEPNYRRTKPDSPSRYKWSCWTHITDSGLSATANTTPEERTKGRRVGIQATDSDYVKLAKQGGQKGLLWHDDPVDAKPDISYKPPNLFSDVPDDQHSSVKATIPDGVSKSQSKGALQPLEAPFGTDNCSAWERETDISRGENKMVTDNATSEMQKLSLSQKETEEANKFKKTSNERKAAASVSMSKLLSFGYAEEEKKSPNDDDALSVTSEQTSTIAAENELE